MKVLIKLILGIGAFVLLVVGALIITVAYLDPNDFKDTIVAEVKEQTGRELAIDGHISLSYYPWLGLDVENISLSNAKGFGNDPFFKARTIKARAKLMPLLRKELEMDTLVLHGVTLNLARNKEGINNWDDLVKPADTDKETTRKEQELPLAALVLGGIDIKDANINWKDAQQGIQYQVSKANIGTGELKLGEPINLTAKLGLAASKPALSSAIKFKGTVSYEDGGDVLLLKPMRLEAKVKGKEIPGGEALVQFGSEIKVDLNKDTALINALELLAFDSQVKGKIEAKNIRSGQPEIAGLFDVSSKNLPQLFKIAEIEPLASQLAKLKEKNFDLKTTFNADLSRDDIDIDQLDVNVLGNKINAEIHARNIKSDTPAAKGKIKASGADLPALIVIASQFMGDGKQDIKSLSKQLAKAPKSFQIETDFDTDLRTGTVDIPNLSIKALGMTTIGKLSGKEIKSETPAISGELKADGPDLPLVLQMVGALQAKESGLPKLAADLGKLKNKKFNIDTRFNINLKSGKVDMPALNMNAFGIGVKGNVKGNDVHKNNGSMDGKISIISKDPKPLLTAVGQADIAKVLKSIDINTGIKGNMSNLNLKPLAFKSVFSGKNIPNSPVTLSVNADTSIDMNANNLKLDNFTISGLGLDIKGKLDVKQYSENPSINGQIGIAPINLKKFMQQMNQTLPPTTDSNVFNKVALENTSFTGDGKSLTIKEFKAVLDDSRIQGNFNINDFSKSEYQFGVGIDKINIDRYLPPKTEGKPATPETAAASAATELPLETLRGINVKGDVLIGELVVSNAKLNDVHLSLNAKGGDIKLAPIGAKLYNGNYKGAITLDAKSDTPQLNMNTDFSNVNVEPLLTDLTGSANMQGIGNISLALNSRGSDINVLRSTLNGKGNIDFRKGVLKGIDIRGILQQVEVMYESKRPGKVDNGEQTEFDSLTGTLNIHSGIIDNDDLLMLAPGFRVNGNGMLLNLNDETWKYNFVASVDETTATRGEEKYNIGGYSLKVKCRGKIADKSCLPDLESIFQALFKN
ncbi:MAG: AsmA family protein, partial [Proteobacteria bacterium]|nr:AsmA family protein [Pseudomonadota bacterium]